MPRDYFIDPMRGKTTAPALRQVYRLTVVCHVSDSEAVTSTLNEKFEKHGLTVASLRRDQNSIAFVRVVATISSTLAGRAALVRIVNELATVPAVRRLQWETVPNF